MSFLGFGPADSIALAITVLLAALLLIARTRILDFAIRVAQHTRWSMAALAALPVALRLALLPRFPVPQPAVSDDFSYLLLADTLAHFRLSNPTHPMHRFFETFFVLQEPSYSSIFPLGQGMALAIGQVLFGHPWVGVVVTVAALPALCYWMLRAWTTPAWALAGGVLAAIQFGPISQWTNSYWGGALGACAGCLVFGALPRRNYIILGIGFSLALLARPFEAVFLVASAILFPAALEWRKSALAMALLLPAVAITLLHNRAVTGSAFAFPYQVSRYQYGVPAAFTFEPNPVPHRNLMPEQQLDYQAQCAVHDSAGGFFERLLFRARYYRFFFLPALYLALPFFLLLLRERRFAWLAATVLLFALGTNFYPYFYPHYVAAETGLFVLAAVAGLARLALIKREAALVLMIICLAHFVFWYGLLLADNQPMRRFETWDAINQGDPEGRIAVANQLRQTPGKHLVFVRYGPGHAFTEWVHNRADIDSSRVVWARDLGSLENRQLLDRYTDRTAWVLEADTRPPRLAPYPRR